VWGGAKGRVARDGADKAASRMLWFKILEKLFKFGTFNARHFSGMPLAPCRTTLSRFTYALSARYEMH
jgi:hypothetical protein